MRYVILPPHFADGETEPQIGNHLAKFAQKIADLDPGFGFGKSDVSIIYLNLRFGCPDLATQILLPL